MTGDEVTTVAVDAIIGDAIVNSCGVAAGVIVHVALRGSTELLGAIETRNVTRAVQVVQFGGCKVDGLSVARGVAIVVVHRGRRRFLEHRQERRVHHARPAVAHSGDRPSSEATPPSGRGEWKAGLPERAEKSVLCGREDLVSTVKSSVGDLSPSATWPSELTPAHVPRSPAPFEARAGADMR